MNFVPTSESPPSPAPKTSSSTHGLILSVVIVVTIASLGAGVWSWAATQGNRIVPHVRILGINVGGMTRLEATKTIQQALDRRWKDGVRVRFDDKTITLGTQRSLINYEIETTILQAKQLGRAGSRIKRLTTPILVAVFGYDLQPTVTINKVALKEHVTRTLGEDLQDHRDARLIVEATDTTSTVRVESEEMGRHLNVEGLITALEQAALSKDNTVISLKTTVDEPTVTSADLTRLVPEAQDWLARAPFTLSVEDIKWIVKRSDVANWINVNTSTHPLSLIISTNALTRHARLHAKDLLKPVHDGHIVVDEDGKATAFEAPEEGVDIDTSTTIDHILTGWQAGSSTISIALARIEPKILGDGERLGIHEIVGVGRSTFSGSPINRRKNIALGAKKVTMTLVPPNEEFSMLKTLGVIDGEHGWLPELVIKGNKTTPEFGGGLCQVGTTMFRAALASGFPITERRNHSYRVRYYEPAGTDATIYDPAPDFKFKNDLAGRILITTRVQGDNLIFTVWGKKDGRTVTQTSSKVFNIVAAPPKKVIETLDLKPGEEKCSEKEHAGADAQFDYTVTYPDGNVIKKSFFSRYKPWQAVCLKGVEKLTQPIDGVDQTGVNNPNL